MSIVRALRPKQPERSTVPMWQLASLFPGAAVSGYTSVTTVTRSIQNAAVWACIGLITDAIARTPVDAIRYHGDTRETVTPTPRIIANPNPSFVTATAWRRQLGFSLATHGNAIGVVTAFGAGALPAEIQLIDPYCASLEVKDGRKWIGVGGDYDTTWDMGGKYWHCTGRDLQPGTPYGLSPITAARNSIGLGLAAEDFSNGFFSEGGNPKAGLIADADLSPEQASAIKSAFLSAVRPGSREPFVHGSGLKYEQYSVQPGETQFIDTMRFVAEQVARFWHVPATAIGAAMSGQSVTYASVSDVDLRALKDTYIGYFVEIEAALSPCLPRPQQVKFNQDAILRGDPRLRTEIIAAQIEAKLLSVNEGRRLLDLPPWPDPMYDEPGIPGGPLLPAPAALNPQGTP